MPTLTFLAPTYCHRVLALSCCCMGVWLCSCVLSSGWTPLHVAAENDQFDVAITLLRAGAGVDVAREDGATALHVAAGNGFADIVTLLLRKGADMEAVTRDRWYPLHMSCGNGHSAVTELLLRKGASVDATADAGT